MQKTNYIREMLTAALLAALAYVVAARSYVKADLYSEIWVLYLGNFLFAAVIGIFLGWFRKKHAAEMYILRLVVSGGKTAVAGIAMSCIGCLLLLWIYMPSVVNAFGEGHFTLRSAPAQFSGSNKGYASILFLNAVIGNAAAAFFISVLLSFSLMSRNRGPL